MSDSDPNKALYASNVCVTNEDIDNTSQPSLKQQKYELFYQRLAPETSFYADTVPEIKTRPPIVGPLRSFGLCHPDYTKDLATDQAIIQEYRQLFSTGVSFEQQFEHPISHHHDIHGIKLQSKDIVGIKGSENGEYLYNPDNTTTIGSSKNIIETKYLDYFMKFFVYQIPTISQPTTNTTEFADTNEPQNNDKNMSFMSKITEYLFPKPYFLGLPWMNTGETVLDTSMKLANEPQTTIEKILSSLGRRIFITLCVVSSKLYGMYGGASVKNGHIIDHCVQYRPKKHQLNSNQQSHNQSHPQSQPQRPLLSISNHTTTLDDPIAISNTVSPDLLANPSITRWVLSAKDICFRSAMSYFFAFCKCLPIERGAGMHQHIMPYLHTLLSQGEWLHIYPEGRANFEPYYPSKDAVSRNPNFLSPFRRGSAYLAFCSALRAEEPLIIPFVHTGLCDSKPGGGFAPFSVGKPFVSEVSDPIDIDDIVEEYKAHLNNYLTDKSEYYPDQEYYIHRISNRFQVILQEKYDNLPAYDYTCNIEEDMKSFVSLQRQSVINTFDKKIKEDKNSKESNFILDFYTKFMEENNHDNILELSKNGGFWEKYYKTTTDAIEAKKVRYNSKPAISLGIGYPSRLNIFDAKLYDAKYDKEHKTEPLDLERQMNILLSTKNKKEK